MLRLTLLLCFTLFATLLIGGRDFGQARFGLQGQYAAIAPAEAPVTVQPAAKVAAQTVAVQPVAVVQAAAVAQPDPAPESQVVTVGYASDKLVIGPAPAPEPARQFIESPIKPVRYVTAASVNVREGPSTDFGVVGRLTRGEAAMVVLDEGNGWSLIRIEGDGIEGYVSSRYLAAALN